MHKVKVGKCDRLKSVTGLMKTDEIPYLKKKTSRDGLFMFSEPIIIKEMYCCRPFLNKKK